MNFLSRKEKAVSIVYYFKDWKYGVEEWQKTFFDVLSWQNTWEMAYECTIKDGHNGVYLHIVVPKEKAERTLDWLDAIGYDKEHLKAEDTKIVTVCPKDWDEEVYEYYMSYYAW